MSASDSGWKLMWQETRTFSNPMSFHSDRWVIKYQKKYYLISSLYSTFANETVAFECHEGGMITSTEQLAITYPAGTHKRCIEQLIESFHEE